MQRVRLGHRLVAHVKQHRGRLAPAVFGTTALLAGLLGPSFALGSAPSAAPPPRISALLRLAAVVRRQGRLPRRRGIHDGRGHLEPRRHQYG